MQTLQEGRRTTSAQWLRLMRLFYCHSGFVDRYIQKLVVTLDFCLPDRSMNQLCVLRPGGRWSVISRLSGLSGGEPSLLT